MGIYAIVNHNSPTLYCSIGKPYVGQSKSVGKRIKLHVWGLDRRKHANKHLERTWHKYSSSSFGFYLLEETTAESLTSRENFWIDKFKSNNGRFGYNQRKGFESKPDKNFYSFQDAKTQVCKLMIRSKSEYCRLRVMDARLPSHPSEIYERQWNGWGDFLGTNVVSPSNRQFREFELAKEFVHSLNIADQKEWQKWCVSGNRPCDIPSLPNCSYVNSWNGWRDWLGGSKPTKPKSYYLTYEEAASSARSMNIKSCIEYSCMYKKDGKLPSSPRKTYPGRWNGWKEFLEMAS